LKGPLGLEDTIEHEYQYMTCDHDPIGNLLSITETCQQIHAKCALLFFSINKFGGHRLSQDEFYDDFLDSITDKQRESITHWWVGTCCMKCFKVIDAPLERLPGLRTLTFEACDKQEGPSDVHEARLKDLVRQKSGRDVTALFDYTTRFLQNLYYQADIDDIEVRHPAADDENDDNEDDYDMDEDDDDHDGDDGDEEDDDDEQGSTSSDTEDEAIIV
jgi:hypothetical protein